MFEHFDHGKDNLSPIDEDTLFSMLKQKFEEVLKYQKEIDAFMKEVKQILNKEIKTDSIRLKAIFEKFDLYIKAYNLI